MLILIDILLRRFPEIIDKAAFTLSKLKSNKKELLKINKKVSPKRDKNETKKHDIISNEEKKSASSTLVSKKRNRKK